MNETLVTLHGWLGGDVSLRRAGEAPVATFRLASRPRRWSRRDEQWVDGETQWYTVTAWRALAENAAHSLRRGDPVVVHGRLSTSTWVNQAGVEVAGQEIEALLLGHDLGRGRSSFQRTPRAEAPSPSEDETASAATPEDRSDGAAA